MGRLNKFQIKIETGAKPLTEPPQFRFNGFTMHFDHISGGTGANETYEGEFAPQSFPHAMVLAGPTDGEWEIKGMSITYDDTDGDPYTVDFGAFTLTETTDADIYVRRPPVTFDV